MYFSCNKGRVQTPEKKQKRSESLKRAYAEGGRPSTKSRKIINKRKERTMSIRKIVRELVEEELKDIFGVEDIHEISRDTLVTYLAKASGNLENNKNKFSRLISKLRTEKGEKELGDVEDKIWNREIGIKTAKKKLYQDHGIDVGHVMKKKIQNMYKK